MARSPFSTNKKQLNKTRSFKNIVPISLTIPYRGSSDTKTSEFDVSQLVHRKCKKKLEVIEHRSSYIRKFCQKAHEYANSGKSSQTIAGYYDCLKTYLSFCDSLNLNAFTKEGYLKYAGNDGELRRRVKIYEPSQKLWEKEDGQEIGIREASANYIVSMLTKALTWCGLPCEQWKLLHRPYSKRRFSSRKPYTQQEERMIVPRLRDLFFGLASQLIAIKKGELQEPEILYVSINFGEYEENLEFTTSLYTNKGRVNSGSAFNLAMGAAYHLLCYFTSLNDSVVRSIAHPITICVDSRDKSLKTVKITGFKARANKLVEATLTNESDFSFDIDKKDGVLFIKTLAELSSLYGSSNRLLFQLDNKKEESNKFELNIVNQRLISYLNLITPHRASVLPWFKELLYSYFEGKYIELTKTTNHLGRSLVKKRVLPINNKSIITQGILHTSYCILSCYSDIRLKGILIPLTYSKIDKNGNIKISFSYRCGNKGHFVIPARDKCVIQRIELWAKNRAERQSKSLPKYLLKVGNDDISTQWEGLAPISATLMGRWGIKSGEYFISLSSGAFRATTAIDEYEDNGLSHLRNLLQNALSTLNKSYVNGNPETNKSIICQSVMILENIAAGDSLELAKEQTRIQLGIPMLTYNEWLEAKSKTNPNGIACNGIQDMKTGNSTQKKTNKKIGKNLPCAEFDMCYKCKSARSIDEPQALYKLISFIDVLRESLNQYPHANQSVIEKIEAFECTLDSASEEPYEEAMRLFKRNGRHPRVTSDHATLSIYRRDLS